MPLALKYVATQAMDNFYQTYKSDENFFTLQDFIQYCGNAISDFYSGMWKEKYGELKADRKDEIVTFDTGVLTYADIKIPANTKTNASLTIDMPGGVMVFPYDQNNCGLQSVFFKKDECEDFDNRAIRTTIFQKSQIKNIGIVDRLFYYLDSGNKIGLINRRMLPVSDIRVYYVPAITDDMPVPESIAYRIIAATIQLIKESGKGVVVSRENGNNPNKILETEIDKSQFKP